MEAAYFITAIVSLATAVVTLWFHNTKREKKYFEEQKENLLKMTDAMADNARSNEHLANAIDDLKMVVVNRKK